MKTKTKKLKVAPDGGWGWVATFGVSMVNLATRSIEPSFGLLFGDLLNDLGVGTTGAAVIISLLDIMMNFSGLFVGPLLKEFSYRKVAIVGSLLCGLGLALTSTANSIAHILMTYSIINGIGVGLATSAAFVALNHYFRHKRGQAVGLSMAGTALGMLIMPQLIRILLEMYEFRGAVLLLAGVSIHALVGSVLLQPVKWHMKEIQTDVEMHPFQEIEPINEDDEEDYVPEMKNSIIPNIKQNHMRKNLSEVIMTSTTNGFPKRPTFPRITSNIGIMTHNDSFIQMNSSYIRQRKLSIVSNMSHLDFTGSMLQVHMNIGDDELEQHDQALKRINSNKEPFDKIKTTAVYDEIDMKTKCDKVEKKPSFWKRLSDLMDFDLLKDGKFLNIIFGLSIFYVAEMNFKMITPFFFANLGYTKSEVAYCLSITAISDIAARVVLPPIFDRLKVKKRTVFLISIIFVAITRSIMAEQTEWNQLLIWLSICGFFRGSALSNFTLTVSEYCSLEKLPSAFGWHLVGKGIFVIAFGPLIGAIRDLTNSFPICIHSQSFCIFMCCFAWLIEILVQYKRRNQTARISTVSSS